MPFVFIGIAVACFFVFTNPIYNDISMLNGEVVSYNEALNNSKALENERDKLTAKYNAISVDNLDRLQKFLPDNIDNIRLILEIEKVALPYGMVLKDVKYNATEKNTTNNAVVASGTVQGGGVVQAAQKDYGVWNLGFSTSGTYNNFLNFTKDLENNLRIVDISSVSFSSDTDPKLGLTAVYNYDFKIKTYWLKN